MRQGGPPTIFAKSSGSGRAGVAVFRLSGIRAREVGEQLSGGVLVPRQASWRQLKGENRQPIDDAIVIFFEGPKSFTGEDVVELHTHGSVAVERRLISALIDLGLTPAEPGAFTARALQNGRMDLLEVEALGDLLDAETEGQRAQAIAIREGEAGAQEASWRDGLIAALGSLEAAIDFPDEEDIPAEIAERAVPYLSGVAESMRTVLRTASRGQRLREGIDLALIGAPNAGKSSILNRLLGEERAIVSDRPGTTRDIVSERIEISGRLVNILDTAGLRDETEDDIEREGMSRSLKAAMRADIVVRVNAPGAGHFAMPALSPGTHIINIRNKSDIVEIDGHGIAVSAKTGAGWDDLMEALESAVEEKAAPSLFPRERQQALIQLALDYIERVLENQTAAPELLADDIRGCLSALDQLVGRVTPDDVLGSIFASFCVGK